MMLQLDDFPLWYNPTNGTIVSRKGLVVCHGFVTQTLGQDVCDRLNNHELTKNSMQTTPVLPSPNTCAVIDGEVFTIVGVDPSGASRRR